MRHIEVVSPRRWTDGSTTTVEMSAGMMHEANFVLDLTTFKVFKHCYGDSDTLTPSQAHEWLTFYLEQPNTRILLLV